MTDYTSAQASLAWLEQDQRDRYRPAPPQELRTPIERYAKALGEARTPLALRVDVGWLR